MPKRRANGEGNIRKRKDGRWEGRYTAGYDQTGKRIIKNVLGKTQAEVKEKLKAAISESQRLDVSKAGSYTVASWVNTWNEFLFSNTFLQKEEMRTVSLRFFNFVGKNGADYGYIYAAAIISILPIIIIYFLMQDSFVEGMTTGSVKG